MLCMANPPVWWQVAKLMQASCDCGSEMACLISAVLSFVRSVLGCGGCGGGEDACIAGEGPGGGCSRRVLPKGSAAGA